MQSWFFCLGLVALLLAGCAGQGGEGDGLWAAANEGVVGRVIRQEPPGPQSPVPVQELEVEIVKGPHRGRVVIAEAGLLMSGQSEQFRPGRRVLVELMPKPGPEEWVVTDAVRRPALYWLAAFFAVLVAAVGGWRGLASIVGLAVSFAVMALYMLPRLVRGDNPLVISVAGACVIMVVTLYLAHGFSRKTSVAIAGTAVSLVVTGLLATLFVKAAYLSGVSEEAIYLNIALGDATLNLQGLLLGSIIIGALGVLDDITVSQSAVVFALRSANPDFGWRELYSRSMAVGRDHIASLVNTLVLAYAGSSLPLLLLFTTYQVPFGVVLNREIVAVEVVRTLVGSAGLVLAVPLTTAMAASVALRAAPGAADGEDHHHPH